MAKSNKSKILLLFIILSGAALVAFSAAGTASEASKRTAADTLVFEGEKHFKNMRMLTNEGNDNAEAYFSFDGSKVIFQSTREPYECDQIYILSAPSRHVKRICMANL